MNTAHTQLPEKYVIDKRLVAVLTPFAIYHVYYGVCIIMLLVSFHTRKAICLQLLIWPSIATWDLLSLALTPFLGLHGGIAAAKAK